MGVALNEEAILLLKDLALSYRELEGGSLYRVRRELEKLAAYVEHLVQPTPPNVVQFPGSGHADAPKRRSARVGG